MKPHVLVFATLLTLSATGRSAFTPIFEYRFPDSYDGTAGAPVIDLSDGGHNAGAYTRNGEPALALSTEVPPGSPAGAMSLDLATINGSIRTDATQLLERTGIVAAGGFMMDVWFKGVPAATTATSTQKILDDTGTEFIGVRGADGDGDGKFREMSIRLSSVANTFYLDEDDGLAPDSWNHITYSFTVTSSVGSVIGDVAIVLNGVTTTFPGRTLGSNSTYVNFNRPASMGRHPTNVSEHYLGLVYNPSMYLGTVPIPGNDPTVSVSRTATGLELTFDGVLQSSPDLSEWTDVPGAVSPHSFPFAEAARIFFRARR
jgi:hypothetical protein